MTATTTPVLAPTAARAVTPVTSRTPPPRMTFVGTTRPVAPPRWDQDEQSAPSAIRHGKRLRRSTAGPLRAGELVICSRQVSAGPDFAVAQVTGLPIGCTCLRELTVACVGALTVVQVDGQRLHPGFRGHASRYELEVGVGTRERNGTSAVTGPSIAAAGSALLRTAVINTGRTADRDQTGSRP